MRNFRLAVLIAFVSLCACGSGKNGPLSRDEAIDIAAHHLMGKSFDIVPPSEVHFKDGNYTIFFTYPVPGGRPGETYRKKVVFEAGTKELLEIEMIVDEEGSGGSNSAAAAENGSDGAYRATPLREEVDQVGELRDKVLKAMPGGNTKK